MRLSRAERSVLADWWFSVDRVLLAAFLVIAGTGLLLSLAASPAVAIRRGLPTYYFVERHLFFACASVAIMLAVSLLSPAKIRRLALAALIAGFLLMAVAIMFGTEINGARRWLHFGGHSLQPSEFAKPAFAVLCAWSFAEAQRRPDMPAAGMAFALYLLFAALLVAQPDIGQTLLISLVWCTLFLLSGRSLRWMLAFVPALVGGLAAAYMSFGYVRSRIDRFWNPGAGDTFQTDRALQSFVEGGFFGKGPGEGTIKTILPDAHTDFIFAVIAEEYGVLACLVIVGLFALIAVRVFSRQAHEPGTFARLGAAGLTLLLALQAIINMAVNIGLLPAKGITLPFISSGGSSMLAVGLGAGMLLGLTRRRPHVAHVGKAGPVIEPAPYMVTTGNSMGRAPGPGQGSGGASRAWRA
jgi:cell division protein FtsW